jgi:hypothetical protein
LERLLLMRPCLLVNACLLLVWCTVACDLFPCRPLPVLPGVVHPPSAPSGVLRPKPLWGKAWSPICFFFFYNNSRYSVFTTPQTMRLFRHMHTSIHPIYQPAVVRCALHAACNVAPLPFWSTALAQAYIHSIFTWPCDGRKHSRARYAPGFTSRSAQSHLSSFRTSSWASCVLGGFPFTNCMCTLPCGARPTL